MSGDDNTVVLWRFILGMLGISAKAELDGITRGELRRSFGAHKYQAGR